MCECENKDKDKDVHVHGALQWPDVTSMVNSEHFEISVCQQNQSCNRYKKLVIFHRNQDITN